MKYPAITITVAACMFFASCDVQSGITQKSLEKYQPTPTPERIAKPTEAPIDPADVMNVDVSVNGPILSVNAETDKKNLNCDKYNRVTINASEQEITIKGGCSKIVVNGRGNRITADGATEFVTYGQNNTIQYSKYVSGKRPILTDSNGTNTVSKVDAAGSKPAPAKSKR